MTLKNKIQAVKVADEIGHQDYYDLTIEETAEAAMTTGFDVATAAKQILKGVKVKRKLGRASVLDLTNEKEMLENDIQALQRNLAIVQEKINAINQLNSETNEETINQELIK